MAEEQSWIVNLGFSKTQSYQKMGQQSDAFKLSWDSLSEQPKEGMISHW